MFLIEGGIVMIANLVTILIMGMTFLYMMTKAQYAEPRRVALIPLGVCAVEMLLFGLHQGGGAFIVTLLLWVSRAAILVCCAGAMRRDAARAQRRQRGRAGLPLRKKSVCILSPALLHPAVRERTLLDFPLLFSYGKREKRRNDPRRPRGEELRFLSPFSMLFREALVLVNDNDGLTTKFPVALFDQRAGVGYLSMAFIGIVKVVETVICSQ